MVIIFPSRVVPQLKRPSDMNMFAKKCYDTINNTAVV